LNYKIKRMRFLTIVVVMLAIVAVADARKKAKKVKTTAAPVEPCSGGINY